VFVYFNVTPHYKGIIFPVNVIFITFFSAICHSEHSEESVTSFFLSRGEARGISPQGKAVVTNSYPLTANSRQFYTLPPDANC
jgi:hypothetical protein